MPVLWFLDPAMFFISYPFSLLPFTVTSYSLLASENKPQSVIAVLVGFNGQPESPTYSSFILRGVIIIIFIICLVFVGHATSITKHNATLSSATGYLQ